VVHLIGKGTTVPDLPVGRESSLVPSVDVSYTHELLRRIRAVLDEYPQEPMMVGEVYLLERGQTVRYLGDDDELHLTFDFRTLHTRWDTDALRSIITLVQDEFAAPHWPTWVLSNHDRPRHRTRYGSDARARAAAVLSLTVRGTPFLYAGEELGLEDAVIPDDRVVDPGGRDGCRAPIPWTAEPGHGWGDDPWLPFPPDSGARSVAAEEDDPTSMLHLYRRLLRLRRDTPALRSGSMVVEPRDEAAPQVISYRRLTDDDTILVMVNLGPTSVEVACGGEVLLASDTISAEVADDGRISLGPDVAMVVRIDA
jgi:alpha-glucosidase